MDLERKDDLGWPTNPSQVVVGDQASSLEEFAAAELCRYLGRLRRDSVRITRAEKWTGGTADGAVVLGVPEASSLARRILASWTDPVELGSEGFILRSGIYLERSVWLVAGGSPRGVMYGAYALLEEAGITFQISGDLLPEDGGEFILPEVDRVCRPAFERRGFLLPYPLNLHQSIWGLEDYRRLIDQMAKLRLNYLNLNFTGADPTLEYTFRGERNLIGDIYTRETGYLAPRRSIPDASTAQVEIGREHFVGRNTMAPPELQRVRSPEEAHRRFKAMFRGLFGHARKRGVEIGFTMDPTEIPTNFARWMRRLDRVPAHRRIAGMRVDFADPLFEEHTKTWLSALFETYPEAVDLFLWNAEGYLDYPEHHELLERRRPAFGDARRIFEENWMPTCQYVHEKSSQEIVDADIVQMEATLRVIEWARQLRPGFPVGFGFLFRGYVLPSVHRAVPEEIPFMDFQSTGVVPIENDTNADYFADMGARKRYIIPRIDDDGSMFGMPFYLRQYQCDGLFRRALDAGVNGFVAQLFRGRGTEAHVQFLARGTWDPDLIPDTFYRGYAEEVFGHDAADSMERAFTLLEDSEQSLGWRSLKSFHFSGGCQELDALGGELLSEDNPYDGPADPESLSARAKSLYLSILSRTPAGEFIPGKIDLYRKSIALLGQALAEMGASEGAVSGKGRPHLEYLRNRTEAYISHLEMVVEVAEGIATYADAFIEHRGREGPLAADLERAEQHLVRAQEKARQSARIFSRFIDHPSDLAILFLANTFNIQKVDRVADLVRRVANYHRGRPYWPDIA